MSSDPALALAVAYLRINGYFLITDQELHVKEESGYRSLTDIDIIAIRPPNDPGPPHHRSGKQAEECLIVTEVDPALELDGTRFDVIIGEVKTGDASLNPALRNPGVLHAALRRTGGIYSTDHDRVVDRLSARGCVTSATARVRLVAFAAQGSVSAVTTIHLGEALDFIRRHLRTHHDLYRVTRFSDPVIALLALLEKVPRTGPREERQRST